MICGYEEETAACAMLRDKHKKQVYLGSLPKSDVVWNKPTVYAAYVLKDRRKNKKYIVKDYVAL